jgi:DNA-binding MarR family transcriptional regulator
VSEQQLAIHGAKLLRMIADIGDTRATTQVEMAERLGLAPSQVSVILAAADFHGLLKRRGNRRQRRYAITEDGHQFIADSPDEEPADLEMVRPLPLDQWERVLVCASHDGLAQKMIQVQAKLTAKQLHYVLPQLRERGLIYRAHNGERASQAGLEWLRSRGVQIAPEPRHRICLMCRDRAVPDRWYCDGHLVARYQMIANQNDGTYVPGGGQL